jgi:hypothetical protein
MRKITICLTIGLVVLMVSCGQKKHDAAYYEYMVDSIRKAEQVKDIQLKAGITDEDPLEAFFLKIGRRLLPLQSEGSHWQRIGEFTEVPRVLNEHFGYLSATELDILALPNAGSHQVVLLVEKIDSITPSLYLYTLDDRHKPIDQLCIYEEKSEDHAIDFGKSYMDYYITSRWEITLMKYYRSMDDEKPILEQTRAYIIDKDGKFEEQIIEL